MSRIYISFLGTNDYVPCYYVRDGFKSAQPIRFVQEATVLLACTDWGVADQIVIFTTSAAERKNWFDNGHTNPTTPEILERKGLCSCLVRVAGVIPFRNQRIPEGNTEAEIWKIFQCLFDLLQPGDEVVFDITHAFRSIPLVAAVVLHYAKVLKGVTLRGIFYGAFEALGSVAEVKRMPVEERLVRLLDLTALDQLMDWTLAIDRFLQSGDTRSAGALATASVAPILRETRGADQDARAMNALGSALDAFGKALSTCRGPDISTVAEHLKSQVNQLQELELLPPFRPLFETIELRMQAFSGDSLKDGLAAVQWCLDHNLIQQGYTLLEEIIFSYVVKSVNGDPMDVALRETASYAFTTVESRIEKASSKRINGIDTEMHGNMVEFIRSHGELYKVVQGIRVKRNDLNHAGFNKSTLRVKVADRFASELGTLLEGVRKQMTRR